MSNAKTNDRSTWVVQREYQDSFGIVQTEYRDAQGNLHIEATDPNKQEKSYQNGYVDGVAVEGVHQNQQLKREQQTDRNIFKGVLIGVIVSCVVGMSAGVGYYLFQLNQPSSPLVVTAPIDKTDPVPRPSPPVIEQSITNVTPAQPVKPEPQDGNVTIKTQPAAPKAVQAAKPAPTIAPKVAVNPTPVPPASTAPVVLPPNVPLADSPAPTATTTDVQLKTEIVKKFNQQFSRNQLSVDVNQGNVKISGVVANPGQLEQIQPLLRSISGVNTIDVNVAVKNPAN